MLGAKGLGDGEQTSYAYKAEKTRRIYKAVMLKHNLNKSFKIFITRIAFHLGKEGNALWTSLSWKVLKV